MDAMEEVRKKDLKSIVARRLVLFSALERGRPRSDNGSPVAYSQDQFIYNTGLSQEIVADFQKTFHSKSNLKPHNVFTDENGGLSTDMATGKINLRGTRSEPLSPRNRESPSNGTNNIPRQDSEDSPSAFSVRQLRSIFETSTVPLTARNSLEEQRPRPVRNFRIASVAGDKDSQENGSQNRPASPQIRSGSPQNRSGSPQNGSGSPQHRRGSPNLTPKKSVTTEPSPSALQKDGPQTKQSGLEDRPSASEITDAGLSKASPPAFRKDSAQYRPASLQNRPRSPKFSAKRDIFPSKPSPTAIRKDSTQSISGSLQNRPRSPNFNAKRELGKGKQSPPVLRKDSSQERPGSPGSSKKMPLIPNSSPNALRKNSSQERPGSPGLSKKMPLMPNSSLNTPKKPIPHPSDFQNLTKKEAIASRSSTLPIQREPPAAMQSSKTLPHLGAKGNSTFYFPHETGVEDTPPKSPAKKVSLTPPIGKPPKLPSPLIPPVCKPPMLPNKKNGGDLEGKQKDGEPSSPLRRNSPVISRRVVDCPYTGSVYVDPEFKVEDGMEKPPEIPAKVPTGSLKQRTLGRGAIKPYEVVELLSTGGDGEEENHPSKEEITETSKPTRMESMYVETFGNLSQKNDGKEYEKIKEEADGYQEIPDYSEPENVTFTRLDSNEFDLSNLDSNDNAVGSKLTESLLNHDENLKQGLQDHVSDLRDESNPVDLNPVGSSKLEMADQEVLGEYAEPETNESDIQDADESRFSTSTIGSELSSSFFGNSSTLSHLSDLFEGWDSDEFDDLTDDEILEAKSSREKTSDADAAKKKIWNIVNEILATEKAYEKRLHLLDKVFQGRLLKEAKEHSIVPEKVIQEIFSNLSSIYTFHSTMLRPDLEKRISNWSANEKIGDIFKTLGHCLKLYTDYVKNFDHATTTLNQWMKKSPKFAAIIEELQKLPECEHLSLQHHMLEPIQRVPRYKLLLQDYLKKLPKDSSDRAEAEEALVVISEAANHSNNSMKGMDQFKKLVEIEERIVDGLRGESIATASRIFIKEGELVKIAARSDQRQTRVLLLFNDLLLCCNKVPPTGKLKVRQMMDIPGMTLQDGDEEVDVGEQNAFRIRSRQRVLDLAASNPEEKAEWIKVIDKVIKDFEAKRGTLLKQHVEEEAQREVERTGSMRVGETAPLWVKDEDVTMCMLCAVRFSLLSRKHHCRACGRIVCDNCSKYKAQLGYMNNTVKRVCYVCHKKLNADNLQETDSFIQKNVTLSKVNKDPKRRWSKMISEVKGELTWKPPGKSWTRGWFSVSDMVLYVQKGKRDPKAQMTIALPGYSVTKPKSGDEDYDSKHPLAFKLHFGNKRELTYYFKADNEELTQKWLDVLMYSVKAEKPPPSYKTL